MIFYVVEKFVGYNDYNVFLDVFKIVKLDIMFMCLEMMDSGNYLEYFMLKMFVCQVVGIVNVKGVVLNGENVLIIGSED